VILSDLNMPGMSGFEFLAVVRHRFPAIPVIAMSGAFSGHEVPSGVAADAFYQKGSGVRSLLKIMESLAPPNRLNAQQLPPAAPVWIEQNENDADGMPYVSITCPECLRSFHQDVRGSQSPAQVAHCAHCRNPIHYAVVEPFDSAPAQASRRTRNAAKPAGQTQLLY
jgi:CheY-like chemotaxis protein